MTGRLDREVARVVRRDNCSGCGLCSQLDPALTMAVDGTGYARPHRTATSSLTRAEDRAAARRFLASCPGARVGAGPSGPPRHPTLGPVLAAWQAWATDPQTRYLGSSGGALTALSTWLLESGEAAHVVGAAARPDEPRRTVSVRIQTREEALAAAGSRYAPVSNAGAPGALDPSGAFVGKPCEASAVRALTSARSSGGAPLILSFFCAGTPNQAATTSLVEQLGISRDVPLESMRYRGHGWPGDFAARAEDGREVTTGYDDSWGKHLGPTVQWRCKICPDGVGESSDVTAGDFWRTDGRGYPVFTEGSGISALIARTDRGLDVVHRAVAAGVLTVEPIDPDLISAVQPLQRRRRTTLLGRLVGARLAGRRPPTYRGFGLLRLAATDPRDAVRTARGTFRRVRAGRPVSGAQGPSGA